jgi:hypothetical protein
MLAYILALAVALGSVALYLAAFFLPEIHKKNDLIWSGVGLFYALVLWVCAGRIGGGLLLGQIAGVALLGWFAWETLTLRRQLLPAGQQAKIPTKEQLQERLSNLPLPAPVQKVVDKLTKGEGGAAIAGSTGAIQEQLSKIDLSGITEKLKELFNQAKDRVQELIGKAQQPQVQPPVVKSPPPPAPKAPETPASTSTPPVTAAEEEEEEEFLDDEDEEEEEPEAVAAPVAPPAETPVTSTTESEVVVTPPTPLEGPASTDGPTITTEEPDTSTETSTSGESEELQHSGEDTEQQPQNVALSPEKEESPTISDTPETDVAESTPTDVAESTSTDRVNVTENIENQQSSTEVIEEEKKEPEALVNEDSLEAPDSEMVEKAIAEADNNAETDVDPDSVHPEPEPQPHPDMGGSQEPPQP